MEQFWSTGYAATSLDDLARACNMNRPSLYAAFGNKQQIYIAALDRFGEKMIDEVLPLLDGERSLEHSLRAFYHRVIEVYFSGDSVSRGCMVWCTAAVEAYAETEIRDYLDRALRQVDELLSRRFERAVAEGELPADQDPVTLGRLAAASMHSIALRARAGQSRSSLKRLGDATAGWLASGLI